MYDDRSKLPLYHSALSDEPLTLRDSRMVVAGPEDIPRRPAFRGEVVGADLDNSRDKKAVRAINEFYWDSTEQDIFGRTYDVFECENYLAVPKPEEADADDPECHGIAGNVALKVEDEGFLHIVVFHVWPAWHGRGVGRALLVKSITEARLRGLDSIKLGTTNDNLPALYFYQRAGFVIEEVVVGEVEHEHGFEMHGFAGIPVRDEIRMRLDLNPE
jgi:ribosomal protein S18 acetylase RimI-like enzyme